MITLPSLLASVIILFSHGISSNTDIETIQQIKTIPSTSIVNTFKRNIEERQSLIRFTKQEEAMTKMVVAHEGGYCSPELQEAIVDVIKNRVLDDNFPDTITEVLHARNQFTAINNYYYHRVPLSADTSRIVEKALRDNDVSQGALYFCNHDYIKNGSVDKFFKSKKFLFEIDGVSFYK